METSIVVIMVLTNLIMLVGGYLLGLIQSRNEVRDVLNDLVDSIIELPFTDIKKEKNAKPTSRI